MARDSERSARPATGRVGPVRIAFAIAGIGIVGALSYSNALDGPFVLDDVIRIQLNPFIRIEQLDWASLRRAALESPSRPVAHLSFALNYFLHRFEVRGYHLFNIGVHIATAILVFFVTRDWFTRGARRRSLTAGVDGEAFAMALVAALLFVAHPIQTQSVTYVVQRMNSMAAMFVLLSFLLFVAGRDRTGAKRWLFWLSSLASWLAALGSKQSAITLPGLLLLYEWYFRQDLRADWLRRNPVAVAMACLAVVAVGLLFASDTVFEYGQRPFTLWQRVLTQPRVVMQYIGLLFLPLPSRLNLGHEVSVSTSLIDPPSTLLSILTILGLLALAIALARSHRLTSYCVLWFFGNLVLESSFVSLELMFEHRLYLPMVGFVVWVSASIASVPRIQQRTKLALAFSLVALLAVGTHLRNQTWRDKVTLWSDVVAKSPGNSRARADLGASLVEVGRVDEGVRHLERAIELDPDYALPYYNLGTIAAASGHVDEAAGYLRRSIELDPDYAGAHNNLGYLLLLTGHPDEAIPHLEEAVRLAPLAPQAMVALARILATHPDAESRDEDRAVALAERAYALVGPGEAQVLDTLAIAYASAGRFDEAVEVSTRLIELLQADGDDVPAAIRERHESYQRRSNHRESISPAPGPAAPFGAFSAD